MSKLHVTYETKQAGTHLDADTNNVLRIYFERQLRDYNHRNYERMKEVFRGLPRVEYVLWLNDKPVGSFILIKSEDMHYGDVCQVMAHYTNHIPKEYKAEAHKLFMWYLKRFCNDYNCKFYQRSRHVSPNRQLIITKEV